MNYGALETHLSSSLLDVITPDFLPSRKDAEAAYGACRAQYGFAATPGMLMTDETGNAKLDKGKGVKLIMLALAPSSSSGIADLCAFSTPSCEQYCVAYSGNGLYPAVTRARQARTRFLVDHPREFLTLLVGAIDKALRKGDVGVRLNGFSDIRWENVLPAWFWDRYADVQFYDYTKHPTRSRPTLPAPMSLTYSVTERTTAAEIQRARDLARNVAVVVAVKGGKDRKTGELRPLPDVPGMVDGDKNDRRFDDPAGSVVGLRRKGSLPVDSPLVVNDDRLRELFG